jgi:DNA primase
MMDGNEWADVAKVEDVSAADGDRAGHKAANALAERATSAGWCVDLYPAPDGQDWNDVLRVKLGA